MDATTTTTTKSMNASGTSNGWSTATTMPTNHPACLDPCPMDVREDQPPLCLHPCHVDLREERDLREDREAHNEKLGA